MKKMKLYIPMVLFSLSMCFSCTKTAVEDYIELSLMSYMFQSNGSDTVYVDVTSNSADWNVTTNGDFIKVEKIDESTAKVCVSSNSLAEMRSGSVLFTAGTATGTMNVGQLPSSFRGVFRMLPATARGCMSRNGDWYAYVDVTLNDEGYWDDHAYRINLRTGVTDTLDIPEPERGDFFDNVAAISDDGEYILYDKRSNYLSVLVHNGEIVPVIVPEGYEWAWIINMSADASVLVGCAKLKNSVFLPFKWINGEPLALEYIPKNVFGNNITAFYPRGCSDDGSIVYGSEWSTFGLMYWKGSELNNFGIDNSEIMVGDNGTKYASLIMMQASKFNISPNGKYIGARYRKYSSPGNYTDYPVRVDTEMGIFEYLETAPMCAGNVALDNGVLFGAEVPYTADKGMIFNIDEGTSVSLSDWVMEKYGFIIDENYWCDSVSPDLKSFCGRFLATSGLVGSTNPYWVMSVE